MFVFFFFFSSRRRHTRCSRDWSSYVCSSDLYSAPEPGAEPYVKAGSRVATGQVVCIIEAMKIMNEIESEVAGVVREGVAGDAHPRRFRPGPFRGGPPPLRTPNGDREAHH